MKNLLKWFKTSFELFKKRRLLKLITHSDLWLETSNVTFQIFQLWTLVQHLLLHLIPQAEVLNYITTLCKVHTIWKTKISLTYQSFKLS